MTAPSTTVACRFLCQLRLTVRSRRLTTLWELAPAAYLVISGSLAPAPIPGPATVAFRQVTWAVGLVPATTRRLWARDWRNVLELEWACIAG
jgi:hypothetical protein